MRKRFGKQRFVIATAFVVVAAFAAYGFTASNTVPGSNAGDGSGTISGYTITNVSYTLNSTTPTNLDQVAFTIAPAGNASTIKVRLVSGGAWYDCTEGGSGSVTCDTTVGTQATVQPSDNLQVVAAQ